MKTKQSLGSRIRGWFPSEPKSLKISFTTTDFVAKSPSVQDNQYVSPIIVAFLLVANVSVSFLLIINSINLSITNFVAMLIASGVVGAFVGILPTLKVLEHLAKGKKTYTKVSEIIFIVFGVLLVCLNFVVSFGPNHHVTELQYTIGLFSFSSLMTAFDAKIILFAIWERKSRCKIWVSKSFNLFIVPKSGQNSNLPQGNQKSES